MRKASTKHMNTTIYQKPEKIYFTPITQNHNNLKMKLCPHKFGWKFMESDQCTQFGEDFCVIIKKQEEGFRKMYEPY
jgi:hypothetical protein